MNEDTKLLLISQWPTANHVFLTVASVLSFSFHQIIKVFSTLPV